MSIAPRHKSRAESVVLDHNLPPYQPEAGDVIVAYHAFGDINELIEKRKTMSAAEKRKNPIGKFRPCVVMGGQGSDIIVVPISSREERDGHHLEITEPSEIEAFGLKPDRPAYAKVLEATKYDVPNPLVAPSRDDDGNVAWTTTKVPPELFAQLLGEFARQVRHERVSKETMRHRLARDVPQALLDEMKKTVDDAQRPPEAPRRKLPPGVVRPAEETRPQDFSQELQQDAAGPADRSAAAPGRPAEDLAASGPAFRTDPAAASDRSAAAAPSRSAEDLAARHQRVIDTAEAKARRERRHPEQIAAAQAGARTMAESRGIDVDKALRDKEAAKEARRQATLEGRPKG